MNRYFPLNAWIEGLGQAVGAAEQQAFQVNAAEAQAKYAQQQQMGQAIGQTLAGTGQLIGAGLLARSPNYSKLPAMQRASLLSSLSPQFDKFSTIAGGFGLEDQRAGNEALQQASRDWAIAGIGRTAGRGGGYAFPSVGTGGVGTDGGMVGMETTAPVQGMAGPPAPPEPGYPAPTIDPGSTAQYRDAEQKYGELVQQGQRILLSDMPAPEQAAALRALTPQLAQAAVMLRQYPRQKPPTTEQELIQSGVVIPSKDGGSWYQSAPGHWSKAMPPKSPPPGQMYRVSLFDGSTFALSPGEAKEVRKGVFVGVNQDGTPSFHEATGSGGSVKKLSTSERYLKASDLAQSNIDARTDPKTGMAVFEELNPTAEDKASRQAFLEGRKVKVTRFPTAMDREREARAILSAQDDYIENKLREYGRELADIDRMYPNPEVLKAANPDLYRHVQYRREQARALEDELLGG